MNKKEELFVTYKEAKQQTDSFLDSNFVELDTDIKVYEKYAELVRKELIAKKNLFEYLASIENSSKSRLFFEEMVDNIKTILEENGEE